MQRKTFQLPNLRRLLCILYKNPLWGIVEKLEICYDDSKLKR